MVAVESISRDLYAKQASGAGSAGVFSAFAMADSPVGPSV
jgi:hypothetical protein